MKHHKIYLLCEPKHPNLGDQAQLMCTLRWLRDNYPGCRLVRLGSMFGAFEYDLRTRAKSLLLLLKYAWLRLTIRRGDVFVGHSGYFFVDHHVGWLTYAFVMKYFPRHRMLILPQTVNFYSPVARSMAAGAFGSKPNLTMLCRDEVSYAKARELFGSTRLLLFPDIVTSLIGTMHFGRQRDGLLLCARNDVEAHYSKEELAAFLARFGCGRKEVTDTTIRVTPKEMARRREELIMQKISHFATFRVVVTDRYHGTIFAAIASTPVVVINSADHKLSSGVSWFPREVFGDYVQFANTLDEAYALAASLLERADLEYNNPPYFKQKYWDRLKDELDAQQQ